MRFIHLSDLHIGKRVNEFSMVDDQKYIFDEIVQIIHSEKPDAVVIAGDVYDKSLPPAEGVTMFDDLIVKLAGMRIPVYIISGNHDSAERLAFGGRLMDVTGVHFSPIFDGSVKSFSQDDEFGKVNFYLLPFIKPGIVKRFFEDEKIESYTDAMNVVVKNMKLRSNERNVLIAHQFVTGAERAESEETIVGGLDNIDASAFDGFDYVALGHLHKPQNVGSERIRYCGTPLKYSFSEAKDEKSVTLVELKGRGDLTVKAIPLKPRHDLVDIRGSFSEITQREFYENTTYQNDYVRITLTDEDDVLQALGELRKIYSGLMVLRYDNKRTRAQSVVEACEDLPAKSPLDIFNELYTKQNGASLSDEQRVYLEKLIESTWEEEE